MADPNPRFNLYTIDYKYQVLTFCFLENGICDVEFDRPDIEANKLSAVTLEVDKFSYILVSIGENNIGALQIMKKFTTIKLLILSILQY